MLTTTLQVIDGGVSRLGIPQGQTLEIDLPVAGTTGHIWSFEGELGQILEATGHTSEPIIRCATPPVKIPIGGPSKDSYIFKAKKPGEVTLTFLYKRPWEKEAVKTAIVHVMVGKPLSKRKNRT